MRPSTVTSAQRVRERLTVHKRNGVPFDEAWDDALANVFRGRPLSGSRADWLRAIRATRWAWKNAYEDGPRSKFEVAAEYVLTAL